MEIAGVVLQLVQCISRPIAECWKYHRAMEENLDALKQGLEELRGRKRDIESRLSIDLVPGETKLKDEIKNWLESVEKISSEVNTIEEKVAKAKCFSRASLGKKAFHKIAELSDLLSKGNFLDDLVIPIPRRGEMVPTTTILGGETTFKRNMEEIWACLMDDGVRKIGVYGMGGIGKTTALENINNRLLQASKFDKVIWVTVSKDSNIMKLQNKIAQKLDDNFSKVFSENDDERTRRMKLFGKLRREKRLVLILDDIWQDYPLESIGIPEPTAQNGCKLVLTTRIHGICRKMSCAPIIRMELLSETEALNLFLDIVGHTILEVPGLEKIVKKVVQECALLPLAIVTVAGSLKRIDDCNKWEFALEELRERTKDSESTEKILKILKFSYDNLKDARLKYCLLYCALYSEDYLIERNLLIDQLIVKGVIEKSMTSKKKEKMRQRKMKKGQVMLDDLVDVCLLNNIESDEGAKCLKMHDLIRDMALQITSSDNSSSHFLVEAGEGLETIPHEEAWKEDLLEVSLMANNIFEIPSDFDPPNCPRLSTMFLSDNRQLRSISDRFFLYMKGLNVLDISYTSIDKLPESVSDLVNLGVLLLRGCSSLQHVPSLAKLRKLRRLDLSHTRINEVPHGLEMFIKLRYLCLDMERLRWKPDGILSKFVNLRHLSLIGRYDETPKVRCEDLRHLRKLECLYCIFYDFDSYNAYVRSLEAGAPTFYILQVGLIPGATWGLSRRNKVVWLIDCNISESVKSSEDSPLLLPDNVEILSIRNCRVNVSSLCELKSVINASKLKSCYVSHCAEIEHLFTYSSSVIPLLQRIEVLVFGALRDLRGLIRREKASPSVPLPLGVFFSLKILIMYKCENIKRLFLTAPLPNLERLDVSNCAQLVEIISTTYDEDDVEEDQTEERGTSTDHAIIVTLPKLTYLELATLPELQSIPVFSESLQNIKIWECPKLKKIPPLDREPCLTSLQNVDIREDLLDSLEWDYPNAKNVVKSMLSGKDN